MNYRNRPRRRVAFARFGVNMENPRARSTLFNAKSCYLTVKITVNIHTVRITAPFHKTTHLAARGGTTTGRAPRSRRAELPLSLYNQASLLEALGDATRPPK